MKLSKKGYQYLKFETDKEYADWISKVRWYESGLAYGEYLLVDAPCLENYDLYIETVEYGLIPLADRGYPVIRNNHAGKIKPRNLEQRLAMDMLRDPESTIKLLGGNAGTGKTFLMVNRALEMIDKGLKDKIIFVRTNYEVKTVKPMGYLPGDLNEKMAPWLGPFYDVMGDPIMVDVMKQKGTLEIVPLNYMRGRSFDNAIIFVTEGQNIDTYGIKLLVSRVGENSELWVDFDLDQVDDKAFERDNGIVSIVESLYDFAEFAYVELNKCERSRTAQLAAMIEKH